MKYSINKLTFCHLQLVIIFSTSPLIGYSQNAATDENTELDKAKESPVNFCAELLQVCLLICVYTHSSNNYEIITKDKVTKMKKTPAPSVLTWNSHVSLLMHTLWPSYLGPSGSPS